MSSRAVRKALKRLELQKGLERETSNDHSIEDNEDEEEKDTKAPSNPFAMV
jgi:hypothetical protein